MFYSTNISVTLWILADNQELQEEMKDLLKQEEESKKDLLNLFRDLGYGIEW